MTPVDDLVRKIAQGDPRWEELLKEYREHTPSSQFKGEGLFRIAELLAHHLQAGLYRPLTITLLEESMAILKDISPTGTRVRIVAMLIHQLALGKQREQGRAAQYILWLKAVARSSDRASSQAQRAVGLLQNKFAFLREN